MKKKFISVFTATIIAAAIIPSTSLAVERYEVLTMGDEDNWVMELQKELHDRDYMQFPATGYFGTDTQNAVIKFQQENELHADGKAGPETREILLGENYDEIPETRDVPADLTVSATATYTTQLKDSMTIVTELEHSRASDNDDAGEPAAENDSETEPTVNNVSTTLYPGDKGDAVSALQTRLTELEYYEYGNVTGYYGPVTETAVKKFQRTHGLAENGIMDESALALLYSGSATPYMMYLGDQGSDVMELQQRLIDLGYLNTEATGYYGESTLKAVSTFQDMHGLSADGKAGRKTRSLLYSDDAKRISGNNDEETSTGDDTAEDNTGSDDTPEEEKTQPTEKPREDNSSSDNGGSSSGTGVQKMLEVAQNQVGTPYKYGANGPNSFDCSGFVYYVMKNSGMKVSRLSSASYATLSSWTTISSIDSLQVGDLVFFKSDTSDTISHMGIYLGGGSFIHAAPSSGGVAVSGMSSGYYLRNYVTAKRIF